jgi:predicted DNA-binding transcriptional regulator YafY
MEWIDQLFDAIRNRFAISFTYTNIYKKTTSTYQLIPYLLKEHRNRWYVIGWSSEKQNYTTFALDRISSLVIINVKQTADIKHRNAFNAESFFQHATGIMDGKGKPQTVELTITDPISKLVMLEPIHASQQLISEADGEIRIKMTVYVNEEFCLRLLGLGPWCKVSKPASLKKSIAGLASKMQ